MAKSMNICLEMADWFQVLDALQSRLEAWERTLAYARDPVACGDLPDIEDFKDEAEAAEIVDHYRTLIKRIEAGVYEPPSPPK